MSACTGKIPLMGMCGAVDTLASQASGGAKRAVDMRAHQGLAVGLAGLAGPARAGSGWRGWQEPPGVY